MPSLKVVENNKATAPETFTAVDSSGNDGYNSIKEVPQSQNLINAAPAPNNNGNTKEQPANPLQQIVLIIEHKMRNLEKRKNKLESYKSIEKSGKKLTSDQKTAVSKYDECLASLDLTRELCKQFQSIVAAANKEAKKEAKRNIFIRAQQENAKIREVLTIQDVLKHLSDEKIREDFRTGENGACKISEKDLILLNKVFEETQAKRPINTAEPTFAMAVKQAADHLSAIVDGRNKSFSDTTYSYIKTIIGDIQASGYFEKDIIVVEESNAEISEEKNELAGEEPSEINEESKEEIVVSHDVAEQTSELKTQSSESKGTSSMPVSSSTETSICKVYAEAPAATAVPTPSFPSQPSSLRQIPNATVPVAPSTNPLIVPTIPMPTQIINPGNGIVTQNTANVHSAPIIVPTGPVGVPVLQPTAPLQHVPAQQLGATTVQAVENAYFKQHYIQTQMRPIHEVIGTGNFFFLQESEIDKPDIVPAQYGNSFQCSNNVTTSSIATHKATTQVDLGQSNNPSSVGSTMQQVVAPKTQPIIPSQQAQTVSTQSSSFANQPFQEMTTSANVFHHPLQNQASEQRQTAQPTNLIQHSHVKSTSIAKPAELNHIPGFASNHTTVVSSNSMAPNVHSTNKIQNHPISQVPAQRPIQSSVEQQTNSNYNSNIQQFPSLVNSGRETSDVVSSQNIPNMMLETTTERLKTSMTLTDKFISNQSPHIGQQILTKQHNEDWSRGKDFGAKMLNTDDQWSNNAASIDKKVDEPLNHQGQYGSSTQSNSAHQDTMTTVSNVGSTTTNLTRHKSNENAGFVTDSRNSPVASQQAQPVHSTQQPGHRNPRSASTSQFHQNNGSNARFPSDTAVNNPAPTFFKNNERYYQQNQNNNYASNKTEPSYQQRNSVFKNRSDGNSNPQSRNVGYGSMTGNNSSASTNNNGNFSANMDYRSNARPVNSTRNTGPPPARQQQQRNHSGNSTYGGPRGGSNSRGQSTNA